MPIYKPIIPILLSLCLNTSAQLVRPEIQRIVSHLKQDEMLHLGYPVGVAGRREVDNKYYKLYQQLNTKATDNELLSLTKDSSKTILLYSFLILHSRNYADLKEIFLQHLNDNYLFGIAAGCTGSIATVNSFMLEELNPANKGKVYLTQNEYDAYLKQVRKTRGW